MIIENNELIETPYFSKFEKSIVINDTQKLILNSIKIYGLESDKTIVEEVEFYIRNIKGKVTIHPTRYYESFLLIGTRMINAKVITIEAADYNDKVDLGMILQQLEDYGKYKGILKCDDKKCEHYIPVSMAKRIVRGKGLGGVLGYLKDRKEE